MEDTLERPMCPVCEFRPVERRYGGKNITWRNKCTQCRKQRRKAFKKECALCGFIPVHNIQMDVDHIDGNHQNNSPENLQVLCANCHRLKTWQNRDWQRRVDNTPPVVL